MIGHTYHGRILRTDRSVLDAAHWLLVTPLSKLGFGWGKRYFTRHVGDPLVVNWKRRYYFPLPAWGNVSMVNMDFRLQETATMRYDMQPWNDYFAVLAPNVFLGLWTHREKCGGWFTLTLDPSLDL